MARLASWLEGEGIWRALGHIWTWSYLIFIVINFAIQDQYRFIIAPFSVLYVGILTLYVGTKEFDRWYETHESHRHPGELYVIAWTAVMISLVIANVVLGPNYTIHSDIVATYIAVLSIFAVTQKAKQLHRCKQELLK